MKYLSSRPYPNLRTWRDAHRLTCRQAAEQLGMSSGHYNKLERGLIAIKGERAKDVMAKTGVPLEVLVGAA